MTAMILDPNPKPIERAPDGLKIPNVILTVAMGAMVSLGIGFGSYVTAQLDTISGQLTEVRVQTAALEASLRAVEIRMARMESLQDRIGGGPTNGGRP